MNASQYRDTQFELHDLTQGPNSFVVRLTERNGAPEMTKDGLQGSAVVIEIPEDDFTSAEMQRVQDVLRLLEEKAAVVYARHAEKPEDLKATINAAAEAAKQLAELNAQLEAGRLAAAQLELEAIAKREAADAAIEARRREAAQLDANLATMRAAVGQAAPVTPTEETPKTE